eukprot:IDg23594t1
MLWISGSPNTSPDDDVILYCDFCLSKLQLLFRGLNSDSNTGRRTEDEIEALQNIGFKTGLYLSTALDASVKNAPLSSSANGQNDTEFNTFSISYPSLIMIQHQMLD